MEQFKQCQPAGESNDAQLQLAEIIGDNDDKSKINYNEIKLQTIGTDELITSQVTTTHSLKLQPSTLTNSAVDSLKLKLHATSSLNSLSPNQSVQNSNKSSAAQASHQSFYSHSNTAGVAIGDSGSDSSDGSSDTDPNQEMINASNLKLRKIPTNLQMDSDAITDIDTKNATSNVKVAAENANTADNDSDDYFDVVTDYNLNLYQSTAQNNYFKHKWYKLLTSGMFWSRILMLILCFLLLSLSLIYCIGQLLTVKLDLITKCEPKTKEQIWKHSESIWMSKHFGELNEESQYGFTTEPCWTTRRIAINTHELWYSNKFVYEWVSQINVKCVLFGLLSTYCTLIMLYCVRSLLLDIIYVHKGILHQQSNFYEYYMMQNNNNKNKNKKKQESYLLVMFSKIRDFYQIKGWIAMSFVNEALEITLQSLSLLLYNGYNVVDANNVNAIYLAHKPKFIILFTIFLAMNCFGCGIIWLLYTLIPNKCYGLQLKFSIFFIDQFSDLFYSIFPIIIVYYDEYNNFTNLETAEKTLYVLLGQLSIDSTLVFIATFMPLFLLLNKCLFVILKSIKGTRDNYFNQWKFVQDLTKQTNDKSAAYKAQLNGFKLSTNALTVNKGEIYDSNGDLILNYQTQLTKSKRKLMKSWTQQNNVKKISITFISLTYIVYGITILILVSNFFNKSASHCNLIKETNFFDNNGSLNWHNMTLSEEEQYILQTTPELFLWDNCLYKVYPFQFTKNINCKCQCRVLMIENWDELKSNAMDRNKYFNLTQHKILMGMLNHWYMLEKFHINGIEDKSVQYSLKSSIFNDKSSSAMKAFAWNGPSIVSIENGIFSKWKNLEYLKFTDVGGIDKLPNDFSNLKEIKYLSFISSGLTEFDESICQLTKLKILQVERERLVSLPFCIEQLQSLQQLIFDLNIALINVPLAIFSLPNLMDLSLFRSAINYQHLLSYNLANNSMDIDINDSTATNKWFDDNFKWNEELVADYWLALTPICSQLQDANLLPSKLQTFLNSKNTVTNETVCHYPCSLSEDFCSPLNWQDGVCDFECQNFYCFDDGGDCVQLCFMDSQLNISNCTYDKYTNTECDEGCNNKYCMSYKYNSHFNVLNNAAGDLGKCANENLKIYFDDWIKSACWNSKSEYIENLSLQYEHCGAEGEFEYEFEGEFVDWIGDGICDDSCRTDECSQDEADCDQECEGDTCAQIYGAWTYLFGNTVYKLNHEIACELGWSIVKPLLEIDSNDTCLELMEAFDWNKDQMINFREFVVLAYDAFSAHGYDKATQVNCSKCIGVQNYNV